MSNEVTDPTADQMSDTPMESPEKLDKGKGKQILAEQDPMEDDDETSDSEEEAEGGAEGDVEEPDEDNMEEIDTENIVGSRTRGKTIDFAEAAKNVEEDDEDDEDDDDFEDPDDKMMED